MQTTASYHHSSNSQVENAIKCIKRTKKKCSQTKTNFNIDEYAYRIPNPKHTPKYTEANVP